MNSIENKICSRCIMDQSDPLIQFDKDGVCQYCKLHDNLEKEYPLNDEGRNRLDGLIKDIKSHGKGRKYDCIIGVSGGTDSTYQLYLAKQLGLKVLAVHFDNGWDSNIAVTNIRNATRKLNFDLYTYVVDWEEFKDIQIAFLKASTPDCEIPTDIAIQSTLYKVAAKEGIKYIVNGHSFRTEGKVPIMWSYGDGRYIEHVHRQFGKVKMKTFPNYTIFHLFYYAYIKGIRQIRLLYYFDYNKEAVKTMLAKELDWQYYGGHHYESIYTRLYQGYILPEKFHIDKRKREFSALVRSGQMTRDAALKMIYEMPPMAPEQVKEDLDYVIKKLGLTYNDFNEIMHTEAKTFLDYPNYYQIIMKFKKPIRFLYKFISSSMPLLLDESLEKKKSK